MNSLKTTIISQYQQSGRILSLINSMNLRIDPRADFEQFIFDIWDLRSAAGWGLDNWGRILNIGRLFQSDDSVHILTDEEYRSLLFLKAAANISDCSPDDLNKLLRWLYDGRGVPYILEVSPMHIRYVFAFPLYAWERSLMRQAGVMPKPAGVGFEVLEYDPKYTFGFFVGDPDNEKDRDNQPWKPFGQGNFGGVYYEF